MRLPGAAATPAHSYTNPTPARHSWMSARRHIGKGVHKVNRETCPHSKPENKEYLPISIVLNSSRNQECDTTEEKIPALGKNISNNLRVSYIYFTGLPCELVYLANPLPYVPATIF